MKKTGIFGGKRLVILFLFLVILLVISGLIFRVIRLYQASTFIPEKQFIVGVSWPHETIIFFISPQDNNLFKIRLSFSTNTSLEHEVGLPLDAQVILSEKPATVEPDEFFKDVFWKSSLYKHSGMTVIDALRLSWYADKSNVIDAGTFHLPLQQAAVEKALDEIAVDKSLFREGLSISIENGSGIPGLGNKLAKTLTYLGVNVVSVRTVPETEKSILLYSTEAKNSITLERLIALFKIPAKSTQERIFSDMIWKIGRINKLVI